MPFIYPMLRTALAFAIVALTALPAFAQAPKQLYNKTIQLGWSVSIVQVLADGTRKTVPVAVTRTIYVSSAGRTFERRVRSAARSSSKTENAPGATRNSGGEAIGLRFSGNKLTGQTAFEQGARQYVVTFDPGFSSCTVALTFGRESGGIKRRGNDGGMMTIESMTASGESCSIREGNPFGE